MQIGIHISLMRDIMGLAFAPHEIHLTYPQAEDFGLPTDDITSSIRFSQAASQIVFQSKWFDQSASLGNKTTYPTIVALCDDLLGTWDCARGSPEKIARSCSWTSQTLRLRRLPRGFWV